jgi:hypothetical protein
MEVNSYHRCKRIQDSKHHMNMNNLLLSNLNTFFYFSILKISLRKAN